jgi:hypothetical protein
MVVKGLGWEGDRITGNSLWLLKVVVIGHVE